jgi:hypothetical protein
VTRVEIARGLRADGHTFARIEEITGWADATVCDWLREKKPEPTLTGTAVPGEHPTPGNPRWRELVRKCLDPDVDEDTRAWAKGDGGLAVMSVEDTGKSGSHAPERGTALFNFNLFARDIGLTPEALVSYWETAADWPPDERKPRTSFAAHQELTGSNRELLRSGMDEHAAQMAAYEAVHKKLMDVSWIMLDNPDLGWPHDGGLEIGLSRINAIREGGREGFLDYLDSLKPEPRCRILQPRRG